jgi:predicted HD superfamily hydrolase involved in NAD metabolism
MPVHPIFEEIVNPVVFSGKVNEDVCLLLNANGAPRLAQHCMDVGKQAKVLAGTFGLDQDAAELAGWLHDVGGIFPNDRRIEVAEALGMEILPEERLFPMIIHQKISEYMARDLFHITDEGILHAVGCHTTLRADSTRLDQVLFVADKIAWDQSGVPPYLEKLLSGLHVSLMHAAYSYIEYLWQHKHLLRVLHPWLEAAYWDLHGKL